jgi:tetratricopeptide (TPR) repeat protein
MSKKKESIIFDANFFIMLLSVGVRHTIDNLEKVAEQLGFEYYISELVFNEIKAPHTYKEKLAKIINIEKILDSEIDIIKSELVDHNIRFPAQDPDLSLIVLADRLMDNEDKSNIFLVSDDFKLIKNTNLIFSGKVETLSLSSFLLKIQRSVPNKQLRDYFSNLWKKSLNYTLSYMLQRSKIYPAESKITWLLEKAISVTESSILTKDAHAIDEKSTKVKFQVGMKKYEKEIRIADKYIEEKMLSSKEEELIQGLTNFLENLKISREYLKRAREAIIKNDPKDAAKFLKKGNGFLISLLQLAAGQLTNKKNYEIVEKLICSEISKMEFLRAFILVSLGRVNSAIDSIERAALFSTIILNRQTCLTLNYVKALILLFHGLYDSAIMAYNFTEELSDIYHDDKLKLKCLIGKAISLYIQGKETETAIAIMEEISNLNFEKDFLDAIVVFSELGDYFLALGHSQIAANLYNEALELSIDYNLKVRSDLLIEKLKRAYISTVLNGYSAEDIMVDKLDVLLDKAYSVKDIENYNEQIKKISSFNLLFYTDFPYISGKKKVISFSELPKELQNDSLEVVHFEKLKDKKEGEYLFIVSHYELGLLGIKLTTDENITGIAENYTLKLKSTSKVKIYKPNEELKDTYLIRAIIEITNKNECEVIYSLPSFFKTLNI